MFNCQVLTTHLRLYKSVTNKSTVKPQTEQPQAYAKLTFYYNKKTNNGKITDRRPHYIHCIPRYSLDVSFWSSFEVLLNYMYLEPLSQSESSCPFFVWKWDFIHMQIKPLVISLNSHALGLTLIERLRSTQNVGYSVLMQWVFSK